MAKMVERVMEAMKYPERIRNIAICAHIDHGKTTFSDNLLAGAGMMSEELAGKALQLDFHADEQARGITIDSAAVSMVHEFEDKEFLVNLIDTPGHVDFGGDVTRAMRAVDGAIVLSCASEGVMPQTETVLRQALRERVKPILFINKVDRLIKELQLTPEMMQERFVKIINHVNKLIKQIAEKEYGDKWQVNVQNGSVCFGSAFHNWALSIPYMKEHGVTFKDIIDAYQNDTWKDLKKRCPLHKVVLDAVVDHLPNPGDAQKYRVPRLWHGDLESEDGKALVSCDPKGPMYFVITKTIVDPQAGEISTGRLFSGTMSKGMGAYLNMGKQNARIQQVFVMNGAKREIVNDVPCGNIVAIGGLKSYPGETITDKPAEPFEKISHIFEPVVTKAIEAKSPADLPKLVEVLRVVSKEDPSIKIEINEETGEHLMHGMGELHLEVIENRIKTDKGVEITTSAPIVVYRETILKPSSAEAEGKSPNKHNKLYFRVEPLEPNVAEAIKKGEIPEIRMRKKDTAVFDKFVELGYDSKLAKKVLQVFNGNVLIEETRGIVYLHEIIELVMDMFEDVMNAGPLAREPCLGVKVRLMDCKLHEDTIHRGPAQMYPAVREGIRGAMNLATPVLFEPVQTLRFEAPAEYMGEISKLISNKRGQLLDMQQEGEMITVIGKLPVGEMFGLSNDLRSATGGRGNSSLIDQSFERMPGELQNKIVRQIRERKGLKLED
ncbi:elongation factor EF-2 [Candidatus Woesearchaeota archaeon]|nr:elongation factor EF-2 [Candidatus Woesearchaeota archaeon]